MNIKHIAATLAILGSASFTLTGCKKNAEGTEVPGEGGEKTAGEGNCSGEGGCSAEKKAAEGEGEGEGEGGGDAAESE
ncbi:MAG TPA: hypothetical protein VIK91_12595 [Nannocystis sp.]